MRIPGRGLVFPLVVLLLWELAARSGFFVSTSLSYPSAILLAGWGLLIDGALWRATRETFGAALGGMAIGAGLGMIVGIAFGLSRLLASLMRLLTGALRPVPAGGGVSPGVL